MRITDTSSTLSTAAVAAIRPVSSPEPPALRRSPRPATTHSSFGISSALTR